MKEIESHMDTGRELELRQPLLVLPSSSSNEMNSLSITRESILSGIWKEPKQPKVRSVTL